MEDIKSFRLTSKQMDRALAAEVLWCITVDINQETFERELCKLEYFAAGSSSCRLVRRIVIRSLSPPSIDPWAPMVRTKRKKRAAQTEKLKKCLYTALSSLTTVRTVRCVSVSILCFVTFVHNVSTGGYLVSQTANGLRMLSWMP